MAIIQRLLNYLSVRTPETQSILAEMAGLEVRLARADIVLETRGLAS